MMLSLNNSLSTPPKKSEIGQWYLTNIYASIISIQHKTESLSTISKEREIKTSKLERTKQNHLYHRQYYCLLKKISKKLTKIYNI